MSKATGATLLVVLVVAGLGYLLVAPFHRAVPPNPPTAFDLAAVKADLADACRAPVLVDAALCAEVKIDEMVGSDGTLWVTTRLLPTWLDHRRNARLAAICEQLARPVFGSYATVVVVGELHVGIRSCEVGR
jgi:hypothetical protein